MKTLIAVLLLIGLGAAQEMSCPMHSNDPKSKHQTDVQVHGDAAMGFAHDKTTHHFRLASDGGAIEVTVNDAKDEENLGAVRMHLKHIASMFTDGNFSVPMFVHGEKPQGVNEMSHRRGDINYTYEDMPMGGRVRIKTTNQDALNAIHDFIIYQIRDHQTGDEME